MTVTLVSLPEDRRLGEPSPHQLANRHLSKR